MDDTVIARRIRRMLAEVHELKAAGMGMRRIKRATGLAKATVARYDKAETVEELLVITRTGKSSLLDEYKPSIHERFNAGVTNVRQTWTEIGELGCKAAYGTLRDYLRPFREVGIAPPARPRHRRSARLRPGC
ncbi:hypothetical protein ACFQ9X_32555 [Catenulispora yoronensis]